MLASEDQRFPALNFEKEKAADDPPTLLIHGDADKTVPISHSERMIKALKDAGITSGFITMPGAGHGFRDGDLTKAQALLLAWFEKTLK